MIEGTSLGQNLSAFLDLPEVGLRLHRAFHVPVFPEVEDPSFCLSRLAESGS